MSELGKIVLIAVLIFLVILISLNSRREITWDYSQSKGEELKVQDSLNEQKMLEASQKNEESVDDKTTVALDDENPSSKMLPEQDSKLDNLGQDNLKTQKESTDSTLIPILVFDKTEDGSETKVDLDEDPDAEEIYNELKLVEKAVRRYISGGHKISTLKMENIHSAGYVDESIAGRYEVGFRAEEEGYDIVITPRYEVNNLALEKIAKFENIKVVGGSFEYVFWIRAYRN
ncbi:MAG: hypothetical protein WHS64_03320 [Fervidobacterium sp.]|uniref:Uncharacterized protein n=1 Tax=Fervidobacterium gondwanense DSM 13020 TaxID=1121883 RepID=A0A1M7S1D5_FERGO|nr:hypothetical protein [Fervidobacterium gondwanense]UXF00215.1 hypothetical protein IB67_01035 [Fervidobacterium riparium]SHN52174.1 hypothetical protein SAMN02745226_00428 [Fervidobacterium gondwanense DSM 13020]